MSIPDGNIDNNQEHNDFHFCKRDNKLFKCEGGDCSNCAYSGKCCYEGCPIVKLFYEYIAIGNKVDGLNNEIEVINTQISVLNNRQSNIVDKVDCLVYGKCNQNIC